MLNHLVNALVGSQCVSDDVLSFVSCIRENVNGDLDRLCHLPSSFLMMPQPKLKGLFQPKLAGLGIRLPLEIPLAGSVTTRPVGGERTFAGRILAVILDRVTSRAATISTAAKRAPRSPRVANPS